MVFLFIILFLFIAYGTLLLYYWLTWRSVPVFNPGDAIPATTISVIIPARNEAGTIGPLLKALQEQDYPAGLVEVIVIDDHSTDQTASVVKSFQGIQLVSLQETGINSYKKKAIETGIAAAKGELIVTTDADCLPSPQWLRHIALFRESRQAVFIAAPVVISCNNSLLQIFQAMDFLVLQGITGAAVHKKQLSMCNGANLAYTKKAFNAVNGFAGVDHIASGDDMLLMHKIARAYTDQVHYLCSKEAIVSTQPVLTWKSFLNQRIRWASKAGKYDDKRILAVLVLVYLFNLSFLALAIAGFVAPEYWVWLAIAWIGKTLVELPFYISVSRFFGKQWSVKLFPLFQPLHIFYTIVSGFFGQFGSYEWKGRKVK